VRTSEARVRGVNELARGACCGAGVWFMWVGAGLGVIDLFIT
jgi:hypothetical protein